MIVVVELLSHIRLFFDCMNCSPPGFSDRGIFQARILEWDAISFSRVYSPTSLAGKFFTTEPPGKPLDYIVS